MASGDRLRISVARYRTAIVGLEQAGKSVFLMSLLDRLHRMDGFEPRARVKRTTWRVERLQTDPKWAAFELDEAREAIRLGSWPSKTTGTSQYRIRFSEEAPRNKALDLLVSQRAEEHTFYDLSGERLADFSMGGRTYEQWCDAMEKTLRAMTPMRDVVAPYFALLATASDESGFLRGYKTMLAELARTQTPIVTPSTFVVYHEKGYPDELLDQVAYNRLPVERLVARGICGLERGQEFAVLDRGAREKHPELAEAFASRYNAYRDAIVEPFVEAFSSCEHILFLVHIQGILAAGPSAMHATRSAIRNVLGLLRPGLTKMEAFEERALDLLTGGRAPAVAPSRVGFVATKADEIHEQDRPKLLSLLRALTGGLYDPQSAGKSLRMEHFVSSALRVGADSDYPWVAGYIPEVTAKKRKRREPEQMVERVVLKELRNSELPSSWPQVEGEGDPLRFAYFLPPPPGERGMEFMSKRPLPGIGMEDVLKFVRWKRFPG